MTVAITTDGYSDNDCDGADGTRTLLCGDTPCVSKAKEQSTTQTNLSYTKTKLDNAEVEVKFGCSV